jgi:hypothetical protein
VGWWRAAAAAAKTRCCRSSSSARQGKRDKYSYEAEYVIDVPIGYILNRLPKVPEKRGGWSRSHPEKHGFADACC